MKYTPPFLAATARLGVCVALASGVSLQAALVTFSALNNGVATASDPEVGNGAIPSAYQPLFFGYAPLDGAASGVGVAWSANAYTTNETAFPGIADRTGDAAGALMYGFANTTYSVSFGRRVEIPSLYWTLFGAGSSATSNPDAVIRVYALAGDTTPLATFNLNYPAATGYQWQQLTALAGLGVGRVEFTGLAEALNIDDLTINVIPPSIPLPVTNSGFEALPLTDGGVYGAAPAGWTYSGALICGVFNPDASRYGSAAPTGLQGEMAAFLFATAPTQTGLISQTLPATFEAGRTYALTIAFGRRGNGETPRDGTSFGFFDASGVPIAVVPVNAGDLVLNQFKDFTVTYTANGAEGAIRVGVASNGASSFATFVDFDNVRLLATPSVGVSLISSPRPREVVQRDAANLGDIVVAGRVDASVARIEARAVPMTGGSGAATSWQTIATSPAVGDFSGMLADVPAGGWYRVEVRAIDSSGAPRGAVQAVERVGVGEVYVIAGQSNSACYGDTLQNITDDRVSSLDLVSGAWQPANDFQPNNSGGGAFGGSAWPRFGSRLAAALNMPVAIVSCGYGGTSVSNWQPTGAPAPQCYPTLKAAVQSFPANGFRAILWHQGEADGVSGGPTASLYASRLNNIIAATRSDAGWTIPWGVAQASYLPGSAYAQRLAVNVGQRSVAFGTAGVFRGPRTDDFNAEGKVSADGVHFNATGLVEHGDIWADLRLGINRHAIKNGDFESGVAVAEGSTQPIVIGYVALNGAMNAVTDATTWGRFNPSNTQYPGTSDATGGVIANMSGPIVGTLVGGSAGASFVQQLPAVLAPNTTYTVRVALGVRSSGLHGGYAIALMADGVVLQEVIGTTTTLNTLAGGSATGKFTDVVLTYVSGATVALDQALDIRIRRTGGPVGSTPTYLDFDNLRLTVSP